MLNISIEGWEICEHVKCDLCVSTVCVTLHSIHKFHLSFLAPSIILA